jgi:hypothetical protein
MAESQSSWSSDGLSGCGSLAMRMLLIGVLIVGGCGLLLWGLCFASFR